MIAVTRPNPLEVRYTRLEKIAAHRRGWWHEALKELLKVEDVRLQSDICEGPLPSILQFGFFDNLVRVRS